ncbi:MAG: ribosome biogenesis GTPase Der [Alphaproteobacteria bacterium]|nr:ribosome biogenesis GTPase Der [Alphaproteobacteria bacterium]
MFTIALIGRPNVGKSTLFNRIAGKDLAIVDDRPGVTRDWRDAAAEIFDRPVTIIDTAGLEEADTGTLTDRMRERTMMALSRSDLALFIIDGVAGVTATDEHFARIVRKSGKPVLVVVNKSDTRAARDNLAEAYKLGLGDPFFVSAAHGEGLSDLYHAILEKMPAQAEETEEETEVRLSSREDDGIDSIEGNLDYEFVDNEDVSQKPIKIAVVGRPNAGKSTLVNSIIGEDRVLTGPEAGITRDPIAIDWEWNGQKFQLVDTAGLRRKSRITDKVEQLSASETMRIVRLAQIVILVVDGILGIDKQDLNIAKHVIDEGRILILAVNKWDIVEERAAIQKQLPTMLEQVLGQLPGMPVVYLSGLTGKGTQGLFRAAMDAYTLWNKRIGTGLLNRWLARQESRHPAPLVAGRPNRLRYITQIKVRPATFALWCSKPDDMPEDYQRYLVNGLRDDFDIKGVPIRFYLRASKNPYAT